MATNVNGNTALVQVDVQATTKTVTLPSAAIFGGRSITIKDKFGTCSNFNITIAPLGGDTIDGAGGNYVLSNNGAAVALVSDGVNRWMTLNSPSVPFLGSTIALSSATVVASTVGFLDPGTFGISNLQMSTGRFLIGGNEIPVSQVLNLSSINLNFYNGIGSNLFVDYLYSVSGIVSSFQSSNLRAQNIIASSIVSAEFVGDGSRLSNLILPSSSVLTPQFALFTVSSGTSYTGEPWNTELLFLSTLATQVSPIYLDPDGYTLRVNTTNPQMFRVSYMTGGNQDTLGTVRPTITMKRFQGSNDYTYPSVENFEGGGGTVSFLEIFDSNSEILFGTRGLSNYTFTDADAYLYRITFETVSGTSSDIFSTINVWTNYNRFVSTVDFDGDVDMIGTTNITTLLASNITVNGSQTITTDLLVFESTLSQSIYGDYLRIMCNAIIGSNSVIIGDNNIQASSIQVSTFSVMDQSTMTYQTLFISSGSIFYGSNIASAGGLGAAGGSTLSSLLVGSSCNANFIKFWGSIGNYNDAVIAQQSTGGSSAEFLVYKGSSIQDQIRFQTTGSVRFETGVPQPRNYLTANQEATPSLFISTGTAVGLFTNAPTHTLDVIGSARFTTLMSTTNAYAGSLFVGLYFA